MATEGLGKLPKTNYSGLDYDNIIEDIINIVVENPQYSEDWDDFISSNAGRMLTELYAYIGDQLATRIDWYINEGYIGTATQKKSVMRLLKLIGYNFKLPIGATVSVTASSARPVGEITLTSYDGDGAFFPFSLQAKDKNGTLRNYECVGYDTTIEKYDYKTRISIDTGSTTTPQLTNEILFYEGTTTIEEFEADTDNAPVFVLNKTSIIQNSIRAYLISGAEEIELLQVSSFLEPDAQKDRNDEGEVNAVPFIYNVLENDQISIEFGPKALLPSSTRRLTIGDRIRVFYRYGGGENGSITARSINTNKNIASDNNGFININFVNIFSGYGGENSETLEHAALYAPLTIRTAEKTVTDDDYVDVGSLNSNVFKIKSYGNGNLDPDDLYNEYGEFIKPLEVWNYALMKKAGWTELVPTDYSKFRWMTLREENRFNEIYGFRKGVFNTEKVVQTLIKETSISYNFDQDEMLFKNYVILDTPDLLKNNFQANTDFKLKLSSASVSTQFWNDIINYFNTDIIEGDTPIYSILNNTLNAHRRSKDLSVVSDPTGDYITISLDSRPNLQINFAGTEADVTDLVSTINAAFVGSANYGVAASFSQNIVSEVDPDTLNATYTFKAIFDYQEEDISVAITTGNFEAEMKAILEGVFTGATFTVIITGATTPFYIDITTTDGFIELGKTEELDDLLTALLVEDTDIGAPLGGGDYSAIASVDGDYIVIESPNIGYNSIAKFVCDSEVATNVTADFFEVTIPTGETSYEALSYGYQRLTIITDIISDDYKKLILEYGNFDLKEEADQRKTFYLNFLYTNENEIDLGIYYNTAFPEGDIRQREVANRVYNSYYDEDYKILDPLLSEFFVKFTDTEEEKISIFTINNSWTLTEVSELSIRSVNNFSPSTTSLTINIDSLGTVNIPLTDGNTLSEIATTINNTIQSDYQEEYITYRHFEYASVETDGTDSWIKITCPTRTKDSSIVADGSVANGFYLVSGVPADSATAAPVGDYAISYNYIKVAGSNEEGTNIITTSDVAAADIQVGYKLIYDASKGVQNCFVSSVVNDAGEYTITLVGSDNSTLGALISIENSSVNFYFTDDIMKLQKTTGSGMPDLDFYTHFVFDKRFKEGIYEDFPLLSLDEDIMKNYLANYKITALENIFKKPKISTFDVVGDIYYNNKLYSSTEVQQAVDTLLREKYKLENMSFGEDIKKSILVSDIQNLVQVRWVNIDYLGKDMTEPSNNINELECDFNEILTLAEDKYAAGIQIHGLKFTYYKGL